MDKLPFNVEQEEIVNGGRFRIHIQRVQLSDGTVVPFSYVDVRPSVCILPIMDSDQGKKILCIRQYRHALKSWIYELPAGMHYAARRTPEETAQSELREETGFAAERLTRLGEYYSSPGSTNELVTIILATGLYQVQYAPHPTELIETALLSVEEFERLIDTGAFSGGPGLVAWMLYKQKENALPAPIPVAGSKRRPPRRPPVKRAAPEAQAAASKRAPQTANPSPLKKRANKNRPRIRRPAPPAPPT